MKVNEWFAIRSPEPAIACVAIRSPAPATFWRRYVARLPAMRRPSLPKLPAMRLPSLPKLPAMRRPSLPKPHRGSKKPLTPQQAAAAPAPILRPNLAGKLPPLKLILPVAGAIVAILVVVLLIGTCGADDEQRVRTTLNSFAEASREKDYQALCDDLLSASLVDKLRTADQPCEVVLRIGLSEVQSPTIDVKGVQIDGDKATAQVNAMAAGQPPLNTKILLVREDGDWRISARPGEQRSATTP